MSAINEQIKQMLKKNNNRIRHMLTGSQKQTTVTSSLAATVNRIIGSTLTTTRGRNSIDSDLVPALAKYAEDNGMVTDGKINDKFKRLLQEVVSKGGSKEVIEYYKKVDNKEPATRPPSPAGSRSPSPERPDKVADSQEAIRQSATAGGEAQVHVDPNQNIPPPAAVNGEIREKAEKRRQRKVKKPNVKVSEQKEAEQYLKKKYNEKGKEKVHFMDTADAFDKQQKANFKGKKDTLDNVDKNHEQKLGKGFPKSQEYKNSAINDVFERKPFDKHYNKHNHLTEQSTSTKVDGVFKKFAWL